MTLYEDAAEPRLTIDLDALAAGIEDRHVAMSYAQSSGWNSYRQILRNSFGAPRSDPIALHASTSSTAVRLARRTACSPPISSRF